MIPFEDFLLKIILICLSFHERQRRGQSRSIPHTYQPRKTSLVWEVSNKVTPIRTITAKLYLRKRSIDNGQKRAITVFIYK